MKKNKLYICLAVLVPFLSACTKKDLLGPEPLSESAPEFHASLQVNGTPLTIAGGNNDYYMYSSFMQDSGVYTFSGELKPLNCGAICPNSLSIHIRDAQFTSPGQNTNISNALRTGYLPFFKGTPTALAYSMQFFPQSAATSYSWNFGDGNISTQSNPTHVFALPGSYNVCLTTVNGGCTSSICNTYKIGIPGSGCQIANVYTSGSAGNPTFNHFITGTAPFTYVWDFGDGSTSTASNPVHTFSAPGLYHVVLQVTDSNGDTATCNYDHVVQPYAGCTTAFAQNFLLPVANPGGLSNILITWTDAAGNLYTSDNAAQPGSSYFRILSTEDFENNENGQTTKKVHAKFRCTVYGQSGSIQLSNGDAVIGVAYK